MKCTHSVRTDVGRHREHNEDDHGVGEGVQVALHGHLFVVCDGMGGHEAGEVASRIAVESILSGFYGDESDDRCAALSLSFDSANAKIFNEGNMSGVPMGTTGVAAVIHHDECIIANVGDSRAYLIRKGLLRQISRDHSLINEHIEAGIITNADAEKMPYKHVITRALGHQPDVIIDTFRFAVLPGDIVLLSSDGLLNHLNDDDILSICVNHSLGDCVERLVELANERGGNDNITVMMTQIETVDGTSPMPIPIDAMPVVASEFNQVRQLPSHSTGAMQLIPAPQISWQGAGLSLALLCVMIVVIVMGLIGIWPFTSA